MPKLKGEVVDDNLVLNRDEQYAADDSIDKYLVYSKLIDNTDEKVKKNIADNIVLQLEKQGLSRDQAEELKKSLQNTLKEYEVKKDTKVKSVWETNLEIIEEFLQAKRVQNCSQSTLYNYGNEIQRLLHSVNKPVDQITSEDIRKFMDDRKVIDKVATSSLANIRMYLLSFFKWLFTEEKIKKNPMDKIGVVRKDKKVVEYFTDEELEMIRCACTSERDLAIIDILSGSGMRVGELCGLNRTDVDIDRGEMKVYGKGSKERICYLTGRAKVHLRWYLESRTDTNPALFVSAKKPYSRLNKSSVEFILKEIGERSAIPDVRMYPHKFRKTLATQMINRGADISQVQRILGHASPDTTLSVYTNIANETTKAEHKKYIS